MPRALIVGVGGQDGSYLADILLEKGYSVHGLYRHSSVDNLWRIEHVKDRLILHQGDLTDFGSLVRILATIQPDEVYHVADQDNVDWSFSLPQLAVEVTVGGTVNLLEAIRLANGLNLPRVFIPTSSTIFGTAPPTQSEETPLEPLSPYACAKAAVFYWARYYRRIHGLPISVGIMFNHDSPRRGGNYLLQKLCRAAVRAANGEKVQLARTNRADFLRAEISILHAREAMRAAVLMLQHKPGDYCIGSPMSMSIGTLTQWVFKAADASLDNVEWVDFDRPGPAVSLVPNLTKICKEIGYTSKANFYDLVEEILCHQRSILNS